MTIIKVRDYLSSSMAVSADRAEKIYIDVKKALDNNESVEFDFTEIKLAITAFLNIIYGKLYGLEKYSEDYINKHVKFSNTSRSILNMIEDVRKNSLIYYSNREIGNRKNKYLNDSIDGDI